MFCPACGQANGDQGKFCVGCGHNLAQYQAGPAPEVVAPPPPQPIPERKAAVDPFGNPFVSSAAEPAPAPVPVTMQPEPSAPMPVPSTPMASSMENLISSAPPPPIQSIPVAPPAVFQPPVPTTAKSIGIVGLLVWLLLGIAAGGGGAYLFLHEKAVSVSAPSH